MIIWSSKLFMSDSIKEKNLKKFKKIKKKIEKPNKIRFGAHLITVNTNGKDLLDIYNITFRIVAIFKILNYIFNIFCITPPIFAHFSFPFFF